MTMMLCASPSSSVSRTPPHRLWPLLGNLRPSLVMTSRSLTSPLPSACLLSHQRPTRSAAPHSRCLQLARTLTLLPPYACQPCPRLQRTRPGLQPSRMQWIKPLLLSLPLTPWITLIRCSWLPLSLPTHPARVLAVPQPAALHLATPMLSRSSSGPYLPPCRLCPLPRQTLCCPHPVASCLLPSLTHLLSQCDPACDRARAPIRPAASGRCLTLQTGCALSPR